MTFLESLHNIGFPSAAGVAGELLLKATAVLVAALLLDLLLRRRWLLACSALWNGAFALLALLPIACLLLPANRVVSTTSVAANVAIATEQAPAATPPQATRAPANVPIASAETATYVPIEKITEGPAAAPIVIRPQADVAAAALSPAPAPASRWATMLAWAAEAQPWFAPGLIAVYFAGTALLGLRLLGSLLAISRLRRRSQPVTAGDWLEQLAVWRNRCGLRRAVELRQSHDVAVPLVIGFRRPAIIVPTDLIKSARGAKGDAILAHELAHVVRGDLGWQLLERVVGAMLWFHPLAWWAARRIGLARERICDGFAVHHLGHGKVYLETLLEMATRLTGRRGLSLGLAVLRTSQLDARLASVQSFNCNSNSKRFQRCQVRPAVRWAILIVMAAAAVWVGRAAVAVEPLPQVDGLPGDAQGLLSRYQEKSAQIQAEVDRRLAEERQSLIKALETLQDTYTRQGKLDEAVAIRDQLRRIKSKTTTVALEVVSPPAVMGMGSSGGMPSMGGMRPMIGGASGMSGGPSAMQDYTRTIGTPGTMGGASAGPSGAASSAGGTSAAAPINSNDALVGASRGTLPFGGRMSVDFTTTRNSPVYLRPAGDGLSSLFRQSVGESLYFDVTGSTAGNIWGSNPYTDDSSLAAAAVHCGILRAGEQGVIRVGVEPAPDHFPASTQNGVSSREWTTGGYMALRLSRVTVRRAIEFAPSGSSNAISNYPQVGLSTRPGMPGGATSQASQQVLADPGSLIAFSQSAGGSFLFRVTGATGGAVWGTDVYTHDSALATAAVHAGALQAGETGVVKVSMLPALRQYHGSTNNGVTSRPWTNGGSYVSYKVERADESPNTGVEIQNEDAIQRALLKRYELLNRSGER